MMVSDIVLDAIAYDYKTLCQKCSRNRVYLKYYVDMARMWMWLRVTTKCSNIFNHEVHALWANFHIILIYRAGYVYDEKQAPTRCPEKGCVFRWYRWL